MAEIKATLAQKRDRCVLCGKSSDYAKETPADQRIGYIEGAGQLCYGCYRSVYLKSEVCHDEVAL